MTHLGHRSRDNCRGRSFRLHSAPLMRDSVFLLAYPGITWGSPRVSCLTKATSTDNEISGKVPQSGV